MTTLNTIIEEEKKNARSEYLKNWDSGKFEWNHHDGDTLGNKPYSPERIWNFIDKSITTAMQRAYDEGEYRVIHGRVHVNQVCNL